VCSRAVQAWEARQSRLQSSIPLEKVISSEVGPFLVPFAKGRGGGGGIKLITEQYGCAPAALQPNGVEAQARRGVWFFPSLINQKEQNHQNPGVRSSYPSFWPGFGERGTRQGSSEEQQSRDPLSPSPCLGSALLGWSLSAGGCKAPQLWDELGQLQHGPGQQRCRASFSSPCTPHLNRYWGGRDLHRRTSAKREGKRGFHHETRGYQGKRTFAFLGS